MDPATEIVEASRDDAQAIAAIHLAARAKAMPYLARPYSDAETQAWFSDTVGDPPQAWWVARLCGEVVGYMRVDGELLDHLYVHPAAQARGVGTALLQKARKLSPRRIELVVFQRNAGTRAFYERQDFRAVRCTAGDNAENEPDVFYVWDAPRFEGTLP